MTYAPYALTAGALAVWMTICIFFGVVFISSSYGIWFFLAFSVGAFGLLAGLLKYIFASKPLWLDRLTWLVLPTIFALLLALSIMLLPALFFAVMAFLLVPAGVPALVLLALIIANAVACLLMRPVSTQPSNLSAQPTPEERRG